MSPSTGTRLDLEELRLNRPLVVPGEPDASPLYHVLLSAHAPVNAYSSKVSKPAPDEIEAVRDWIEQLPSTGYECPGRDLVTEEDAIRLEEEWKKLSGNAGRNIRFVSFVHLHNACRTDADIAAIRDAVAAALGSLAGRTEPATIETIGELSLIGAFDPESLGLAAEVVAGLASKDPRADASGLTADWLVYEAHRHKPQPTTEAVALDYLRGVDVLSAAAELGQPGEALASRLARLEGQEAILARRLLQGWLPRSEWISLAAIISGKPMVGIETGTPANAGIEPLRLSLWSDKISYKAGDLANFTAVANQNCYLTLIGIDKAGIATVLFPNDLDGENLLRAGSSKTVPVQGASYQLRFKEPGQEGVVAICTSPGKRPAGIAHNFEKERFTVLGPWRTFLRSLDEREAEIAKTERSGGNVSAKEAGINESAGPAQEARAAIRLLVQ
jgi:hypothetical protein